MAYVILTMPKPATPNSQLTVVSPLDEDFRVGARRLGGSWGGRLGGAKAWLFDARRESEVRALCLKIYGLDGSPPAANNLCTLRLKAIAPWVIKKLSPVRLAGRDICKFSEPDDFTVGFSVTLDLPSDVKTLPKSKTEFLRNYELPVGTALTIEEFPRSKITAAKRLFPATSFECVVDDTSAPTDPAALMEERRKLTLRLKEIDAIFAKTKVESDPSWKRLS